MACSRLVYTRPEGLSVQFRLSDHRLVMLRWPAGSLPRVKSFDDQYQTAVVVGIIRPTKLTFG
jgi:hypothetical protein